MTAAEKVETPTKLVGFQNFNTHHCVTGSMRHIYEYNDYRISEEMLLGLGEGISFIYWHQKDQTPFIGGRGSPKPSMEQIAGERTGVEIALHTTSSTTRARKILMEMLSAGQPVMLQVDMGYLPYFDFDGTDYHFGGHVIVACGYNPDGESVLVADRDALHPVSMKDIEKARNSKHKPFPPKNLWYTFDFNKKRLPTSIEIYQAIHNQANGMLKPPISNIGIKGIRKAARMIPTWSARMDDKHLRWSLFNTYVMISPVGGSGGGAFRYMFSRFLMEAADATNNSKLKQSASDFNQIGDCWQGLAEWFREVSEIRVPSRHLNDCIECLHAIAELEEIAWRRLLDLDDLTEARS